MNRKKKNDICNLYFPFRGRFPRTAPTWERTPSPCIAVTSNDVYCENSEYEVQLTLIKSPVPMGLPDLYTDILEYPGAGVALGHYRR